MAARIVIVQGHPDSSAAHLCHALADAYAAGAADAGHTIDRVEVAALNFPLLRTETDFKTGDPVADIRDAQAAIRAADHLLILYPLWLGTMPALLKGFFEQVFRPGFAFEIGDRRLWKKLLKGKSARVVITMGMPALVYRWYFGAHSLRSLERNILGFSGIGPIRETLFGMVDAAGEEKRAKWLSKMTALGRRGI